MSMLQARHSNCIPNLNFHNMNSNTSHLSTGMPQRFIRTHTLTLFSRRLLLGAIAAFCLAACASTELIESPKTGFVAESDAPKEPEVIWTSRTLPRDFHYLGLIKARAWTYEGTLDRLLQGGRDLKADAIIDVHYQRVGFLKTMQAFAVQYR